MTQPQRRKTTLAQEATTWQRALPTGSPTPSGAAAWPRASARPTQAPSWLVTAGVGVEKAEQQEAPLENQRKRREVFHGVITLCLVLTLIAQSTLLELYFIHHFQSWLPYLWVIPDILCIAAFVAAQILSYRYLLRSHFGASHMWLNSMFPSTSEDAPHVNKCFSAYHFGVLPLIYISWLIYSIILLAKLLIFMSYVEKLNSRDWLGFQTFQVTVALAALVFFCLVEGHTWATRTSHRYIFVTMVCANTALEIIDTVKPGIIGQTVTTKNEKNTSQKSQY